MVGEPGATANNGSVGGSGSAGELSDIVCTFGKDPLRDGKRVDYSKWKLFEGPYLNAEKNSKKLEITHGRLKRTLDFNTLTICDAVIKEPSR